MHIARLRLLASLTAAVVSTVAAGCVADVVRRSGDEEGDLSIAENRVDSSFVEYRPREDAGPSLPDLESVDTMEQLPKAGEVCATGECEADSICIGQICRRKCTTQDKTCITGAAPECGADEICIPATTFSEVCYPVDAKAGESCGTPEQVTKRCAVGSHCVKVNDTEARCLQACILGVICPAGFTCSATEDKCQICFPNDAE